MADAPKYSPNPVPSNPEDLPRYIFEELTKLQGALEENPTTFIEVKNATPGRKNKAILSMLMALTLIQVVAKAFIL